MRNRVHLGYYAACSGNSCVMVKELRYSLRKSPEECDFRLPLGRNLKSRKYFYK